MTGSKLTRVILIFLLSFGVYGTLTTAQAGKGMKKGLDFQVVAPSKYSFNDTVDMLKAAIESENLMVIKVIDAQKMLRMVGVHTKGLKQLLFFHPRFMKQIREINKHGTIEAPLKIAIMEKPNGKVMIMYVKPTYLFGRYEGLSGVGKELESIVSRIVASVQK